MQIARLKNIASKLPPKPGVYFFKDSGGKNLYIGKASSLKSRVLNYTKTAALKAGLANGREDTRIKRMVQMASTLKFIATDSDIEALILESQYIKRYRPMFNVVMRDDKQYFYVGFSRGEFPKIFLTHQPQLVSSTEYKVSGIQNTKYKILNTDYVGPFTDGNAIKTTLRYLRNIFPYCTCKQLHNNYCLNYHIGKCPGFCCLKNSPERSRRIVEKKYEYKNNIKAIRDVLSGKKKSLIKNLEKEMAAKAEEENFEEAIKIRSQLERLQRIFENARVIRDLKISDNILEELKESLGLTKTPHRIEAYDISNIQGTNATGSMVVFENGKPNKNEYRKFKIRTINQANDTAMLREVLERRFNHPEWPYPDLVVIDGGRGQLSSALKVLKDKEINIVALTKDDKHSGIKVTLPNKDQIPLSRLPISVKNLILYIDAEAHRFAINYYRKLHRKSIRPN